MEKISVDQIDIVRERANVTYKEAKEILERFNGDIVSSLLYLEQQDKTKLETKEKSKLKQIVDKRIIITKNCKDYINLNLIFSGIILMFNPPIIAFVILSMIGGCKLVFEDKDNIRVNIEKHKY